MRKDPTEFRERFAKWKAGEKVYENGLPAYGGGKSTKKGPYVKGVVSKPVYDEFDAFLQTLPDNQRSLGAYNTRRYWELNGKPKDFAEAIGKGMYTIQNDNGTLNWHGKSVAYNEDNDTYEFMKPNYHPTRWMELVYGYDQSPEFQKDWKVQYNGPMLSDRYVRREKPGLKIVGGQLPGYKGGKGFSGLLPINIPGVLRRVYNSVKERAYRTITPLDYNIPKAAKEFVSGKNRNKQDISPVRNEEWARYLGVPYEGESNFEPSPYRPQKGKTYDTVLRFKDESKILSDDALNQMLDRQRKTGKNSWLVTGNGGGLGTYTLSLGEDEKGKYISYYDDWDINPFKGISAKLNIPILSKIEDVVPGSNPYTVYGRRYYLKR